MMKTMFIRQPMRTAALLLMCGLSTACNRSADDATPTAAAPTALAKPANTATQNPLANMVKAVSTNSTGQPVELRFELMTRPELGKPLELKLNLLGLADASELHLTVSAQPGLELLDGAQANFLSLKVGASLNHLLHVRGSSAGIYIADVQLVAIIDGVSRTLNYAIPMAMVPPASAASESASAPGMSAGV